MIKNEKEVFDTTEAMVDYIISEYSVLDSKNIFTKNISAIASVPGFHRYKVIGLDRYPGASSIIRTTEMQFVYAFEKHWLTSHWEYTRSRHNSDSKRVCVSESKYNRKYLGPEDDFNNLNGPIEKYICNIAGVSEQCLHSEDFKVIFWGEVAENAGILVARTGYESLTSIFSTPVGNLVKKIDKYRADSLLIFSEMATYGDIAKTVSYFTGKKSKVTATPRFEWNEALLGLVSSRIVYNSAI